MIDKQSIIFLKQTLTFWPQLTKEQEEMLLNHTMQLILTAGQTLYNAEKECVGALVVQSGELRTYMLSDDGRDITLYRLGSGDICVLSASCILKSITFDVFIDVEKDSKVLLLNAAAFSKIMNQNMYVENFVLRTGMERFSDVMWAMEQILFMSLDCRLAVFLIDETAKTGAETLNMTHEQIAKYIGSAREVVSRMLKHFAVRGIVELYRGGIRILDREKLRSLIS